MKVQEGSAHLTYCTNVHPSETWAEVEACLRGEVSAVKQLVSPDADFGVGLRLSALAATQLLQDGELTRVSDLLVDLGLYVFTINGFPYGPFHGQPVKAQVYEPDWLSPERARYTDDLRSILARLLPDGLSGSISTVPGGYRPHLREEPDREQIASVWLDEAAKFWKQAEQTGKDLVLAIEPEPACMLETTTELVDFFQRHLLTRSALGRLASKAKISASQAERAVHKHLGICLDTCHAAVEFEDPDESLSRLESAGISIGKVQLSCGLEVRHFDKRAGESLQDFNDEVYLHQTVVRRDEELTRYTDLPEALHKESPGGRWRVHFHVPIFQEQFGDFVSTQDFLRSILRRQVANPLSPHLEVETYTWGVLPEEFQSDDLPASLARELNWVQKQLTP